MNLRAERIPSSPMEAEVTYFVIQMRSLYIALDGAEMSLLLPDYSV